MCRLRKHHSQSIDVVREESARLKARPVTEGLELAEHLRAIASALNERRVVEAALVAIEQVLAAPRVTFFRHERKKDRILPGESRAGGNAVEAGDDEPLLRLAMRRRALLNRKTADQDAARVFESASADAALAAPIYDRAMIAGVLLVHGPLEDAVQGERRLDMLATACGMALSNARLAARCDELLRIDALTGLPGVTEIRDSLEQTLERGTCAVLLIGADRIREVNEAYGRREGDRAVSALSKLVTFEAGVDALVGRYGGATMLVVLPGQRIETALQLAERMQRRVRASLRAGPEGLAQPLTVSIGAGAASIGPADVLLLDTEKALAEAMAQGGNRIKVAAPARGAGTGVHA
jgi:diguanylate cyclase (GGDEF)-like protein